jgi:hypothetical protein
MVGRPGGFYNLLAEIVEHRVRRNQHGADARASERGNLRPDLIQVRDVLAHKDDVQRLRHSFEVAELVVEIGTVFVVENADRRAAGSADILAQDLKPLAIQLGGQSRDTGHGAARLVEIGNELEADRVGNAREHNRDAVRHGGLHRCKRGRRPPAATRTFTPLAARAATCPADISAQDEAVASKQSGNV